MLLLAFDVKHEALYFSFPLNTYKQYLFDKQLLAQWLVSYDPYFDCASELKEQSRFM